MGKKVVSEVIMKYPHNRKYFYKYVTSDVAIKILSNLTCRWSSPELFDDLFDCQLDFDYGFTFEELNVALLDEMYRLKSNNDTLINKTDNFFLKIANIVNRRNIKKDVLSKLLSVTLQKECFKEETVKLESDIKKFREIVEADFKRKRIFCVSEIKDNLVMWSLYSDSHKGCVIKLKCLPEEDSALCASEKVTYSKTMPVIANLDDYVKSITGQKELDYSKLYLKFVCTKSIGWKFQKEWRCIINKRNNDNESFEDIIISPKEIEAIYLGCNIGKENKITILNYLKDDLSHVIPFQTKKDTKEYKLNFECCKC